MGAWMWRLPRPLGPRVAVSVGWWVGGSSGLGFGVGVLVGGRVVCAASAEVASRAGGGS